MVEWSGRSGQQIADSEECFRVYKRPKGPFRKTTRNKNTHVGQREKISTPEPSKIVRNGLPSVLCVRITSSSPICYLQGKRGVWQVTNLK